MAKQKNTAQQAPENALQPHKENRLKLFQTAGFDMPFFILLILVLAVGLVCLFSASFAYSYYRNGGDSYYYIKRQMIFAALGLVIMFVVSFAD